MPHRAASGVLGLIAVLATLLAVEVVARCHYVPPFEIRSAEGFLPFARSGRFTPALNALGFREDPLAQNVLEPDVTRILALGDSFTFGDGVSRGEDRFTDLVEAMLNQDEALHERLQRYHVYNAGRSGSRPARWARDYLTLARIYEPDLVVAIFFLRDGTDLCTSLRCHRDVIEDIQVRYQDRFGYAWSYLARFYYARRVRSDFAESYREAVLRAYLGDDHERKTWNEQQIALRQIRDLCRKRGRDFHLIVFPILFDLEDYPYQIVEDEILRFAGESRIPSFSLLPGFRGLEAHTLWVAPDDQHPNERAHRIAATVLFPYLRDAILGREVRRADDDG